MERCCRWDSSPNMISPEITDAFAAAIFLRFSSFCFSSRFSFFFLSICRHFFSDAAVRGFLRRTCRGAMPDCFVSSFSAGFARFAAPQRATVSSPHIFQILFRRQFSIRLQTRAALDRRGSFAIVTPFFAERDIEPFHICRFRPGMSH